jgi:hypothetical protein
LNHERQYQGRSDAPPEIADGRSRPDPAGTEPLSPPAPRPYPETYARALSAALVAEFATTFPRVESKGPVPASEDAAARTPGEVRQPSTGPERSSRPHAQGMTSTDSTIAWAGLDAPSAGETPLAPEAAPGAGVEPGRQQLRSEGTTTRAEIAAPNTSVAPRIENPGRATAIPVVTGRPEASPTALVSPTDPAAGFGGLLAPGVSREGSPLQPVAGPVTIQGQGGIDPFVPVPGSTGDALTVDRFSVPGLSAGPSAGDRFTSGWVPQDHTSLPIRIDHSFVRVSDTTSAADAFGAAFSAPTVAGGPGSLTAFDVAGVRQDPSPPDRPSAASFGASPAQPGQQTGGPAVDLSRTNELLQQLLDEVRKARQPFLPANGRTDVNNYY